MEVIDRNLVSRFQANVTKVRLKDASLYSDWLTQVKFALRLEHLLWLYYADNLETNPEYAEDPNKPAVKQRLDLIILHILTNSIDSTILDSIEANKSLGGMEKLFAVKK